MEKQPHNITPKNTDLEVLKTHFPQCFTKEGNFDFEKFKAELSSQDIDFSRESYRLDWLGKSYARLLATDKTTTFLTEDVTHNNLPENQNSENILIKGDNLEVLKHLSNAYHSKIKMIYIDPPYNTGSDGFVYQDDRKFTAEQLQTLAGISPSRAERILEFTQSKSNSHSAWLTFMYPRLYIAKRLLTDNGVIFISIDDNEVAQLRLLCDEIFGEENFIEEYIWESTFRPDNSSKIIRKNAESILCYAKHKDCISKLIGHISGSDGLPSLTKKTMKESILEFPKGSVNTYLEDGLYKKGIKKSGYELLDNVKFENSINTNAFRLKGRVIWGQEYLENELSQGTKIIIKSDGFVPYTQKMTDKILAPNTIIPKEKVGDVLQGRSEVNQIFKLDNIFSYPKPTSLIKYLINFIVEKDNNDLILDFFAGSGTTADAVMQLNREDGGNRKFILVQLPEPIDPKKSKTAYDFVKNELGVAEPTIFDITKERIIRSSKQNAVSDKPQKEDLFSEEEPTAYGIQPNTSTGFKIFATTPIWDNYEEEYESFDPQIELFDPENITEEDIATLLTTWKTYDGIPLTTSLEKVDLGSYTAYYGQEKLYLMDKKFATENLKNLVEKIDNDTAFNPISVVIFGHHFESKAIRELTENLKNYSNKKQSENNISVVARY